jgi:Phytanoyl-CoA dioxygenase (PhyH)
MHTIYVDSPVSDQVRRQRIYEGQVFVFTPRASTVALCDFARELIEAAFGNVDPRQAQYHMPVEEYVAIVAPLKPRFIHHPKTKELLRNILIEFECDLHETYQDVPRLRTATSDGYLTSGVGYAFHPHRDTWYSAPMAQLNWWLPIYDFESESSLAFHPRYWSQPVQNQSSSFNYYEYNKTGRKDAALHIKKDTRKQPHAVEPIEIEPQVRVVCKVGGVVLFSGAQLHSTVPNTSGLARYSIDFRTVNINDVINGIGAPNIDSAPTGTSLRDFVRSADLAPVPDEALARYEEAPDAADGLVFKPEIYQPEIYQPETTQAR